jgi:hypothetical protein
LDVSQFGLAVSGANLFAATRRGGIFLSTDNGAHWTAFDAGLSNQDNGPPVVDEANIYAGTGTSVWRRLLSEPVPIQPVPFMVGPFGSSAMRMTWSTVSKDQELRVRGATLA